MEIERKWILDKIPAEFMKCTPIPYLRYIIFTDDNVELRVQRKGDQYELERKEKATALSRKSIKVTISEGEFNTLKSTSNDYISRESLTSGNRAVKVYDGEYTGLIRYEVEFKTEKEAREYVAPEWAKIEITGTVLANDSKLITLSRDIFLQELNKII